MRNACEFCLRYAVACRSSSSTRFSSRSLVGTPSRREISTSSSALARTKPTRILGTSQSGRPTSINHEQLDEDFNPDFYKADELEARLAKLSARRAALNPSTSSSTVEEAQQSADLGDYRQGDYQRPLSHSLGEIDEGPINEGLYRPDDSDLAEEEIRRQKPFGLHDLSLEEPDLGPKNLYGLKKKQGPRPDYPAVIKLRPDLDPVADEEEYEEMRKTRSLRRQTERKRQLKGDFLDYAVIKVRGGRGGSGVASFSLSKAGGLGGPFGGNGGVGGSVYIQATEKLTSLHTIPKRYMADQGKNGGRELRHGQAGEDIIVQVPVGTVVREIIREGDEERHWQRMEELEIPMEDRKWDRWERVFHLSKSDPFDENTYIAAERLLRKDKIWATRTPTFEEKPPIVFDLDKPTAKPRLLSQGGLGGKGNTYFAGVMGYRQARFSSRGIMPYTSTFEVELKIIADVGLVGFPNAGKSTILRALTGRRAEVAGYQFTTLNPQIGVVKVWDDGSWGSGGTSTLGGVVEETWKERKLDEEHRNAGEYASLPRAPRIRSVRDIEDPALAAAEGEPERDISNERVEAYRYTISDNPGLLPEASENVGLGHTFLRSIERCLALAYVVDIARPNPEEDLLGLRHELEAYKPGLAGKGAVVILNKADEVDSQAGKEKLDRVRLAIQTLEEGMKGDLQVVVVSGKYGLGLDKLVRTLGRRVERVRDEQEKAEEAKRNESRF